jgi:hypothetical protein
VHADQDANGVLGALEPVIAGGTCVTDSTGACTVPLAPGNYVVTEKLPPVGYAPAPDLAIGGVQAGQVYTASFTNRSSLGAVAIVLTDDADSPQPLAGGSIQLLADDGDGKRGAGDKLLAACMTESDGTCPLRASADGSAVSLVPLGSYVVHEDKAPVGYRSADDVAFSLKNPGDAALVRLANGRDEPPAEVAVPGAPSASTPSSSAPFVTITPAPPLPPPTLVSASVAPPPHSLRRLPGFLRLPAAAAAAAVRFLLRNPGEGLAAAATAALFAGPFLLTLRRRRGRLLGLVARPAL